MSANAQSKPIKKKGFWRSLFEKLDKRLQEQAKRASCCSEKDGSKKNGSSCC